MFLRGPQRVGIAFGLGESAGSTQHRRRIDQALRELVAATV
jgi:hypothetical protein